jgi:hypothetical protein
MDKAEVTEKAELNCNPPPIRAHARFNRAVFVRETLHIADYEPDEVIATWYQKDEMAQMKADMVDTVRSMLRGELENDNEEQCMRGLESRTRIGANKRQENKLRALEAVLDEQDREFEAGIIDERTISLGLSAGEAFGVGTKHTSVVYETKLRYMGRMETSQVAPLPNDRRDHDGAYTNY